MLKFAARRAKTLSAAPLLGLSQVPLRAASSTPSSAAQPPSMAPTASASSAAPTSAPSPLSEYSLRGSLPSGLSSLQNYHHCLNIDTAVMPLYPLPPLLGQTKTKAQRDLAAKKALASPLPGVTEARDAVVQEGADRDFSINPIAPTNYETPYLHPSPYVLFDGESHKMGEMLDHPAPADKTLLPLSSIMELNTDLERLMNGHAAMRSHPILSRLPWSFSQGAAHNYNSDRVTGIIHDRCNDEAFYDTFAVDNNIRGYIACLYLHSWAVQHSIIFRPPSHRKDLTQPLHEHLMWRVQRLLKDVVGIKRERHLEQYLREMQNLAYLFYHTMDKAVYAALCGNYDLLYGALYRFVYRYSYMPPAPWIRTVRPAPPAKERIFLEKPLEWAHMNRLTEYTLGLLYSMANLPPAEYYLFLTGQMELPPLPSAPLSGSAAQGFLTRDDQIRFSPHLYRPARSLGVTDFLSDVKTRFTDPVKFAEMSFTSIVRPGRFDLEQGKARARASGAVFSEDVAKFVPAKDYHFYLHSHLRPFVTPGSRGDGARFLPGATEAPVVTAEQRAMGLSVPAAVADAVKAGREELEQWDGLLPSLRVVPKNGGEPFVVRDGPPAKKAEVVE